MKLKHIRFGFDLGTAIAAYGLVMATIHELPDPLKVIPWLNASSQIDLQPGFPREALDAKSVYEISGHVGNDPNSTVIVRIHLQKFVGEDSVIRRRPYKAIVFIPFHEERKIAFICDFDDEGGITLTKVGDYPFMQYCAG